MEETNTYRAVRIDDTAEWRMIIYISRNGMSAFLKNEEDPMEPLIVIFSLEWEKDDIRLLSKIEAAVYDHPQLLDDFSTEIIINTEKSLWVPAKVVDYDAAGREEEYREEADLYNMVYEAADEDIFMDEIEDKVCLYSLEAGLLPFIRRTLPGARTWCQQTLAVRRFADQVADMPRLYVDIREGEADYYGFDGRKLLFAVTHPWKAKSEIPERIFSLMEVFRLDKSSTQVMLSGKKDIRAELMGLLREELNFVMLTMLPSSISKCEQPLAVGLALTRR
ncbi:MAG: DUF3822 family protein [Bacteroidales bacterium]|nr:DUF3822 family protein [Bacteroidales bacterium]